MATDDLTSTPRRAFARTRLQRRPKRTRLIATVPMASGSPRRYYEIGDETDEEIARRIVADVMGDGVANTANDRTPTGTAADPSPTSTA